MNKQKEIKRMFGLIDSRRIIYIFLYFISFFLIAASFYDLRFLGSVIISTSLMILFYIQERYYCLYLLLWDKECLIRRREERLKKKCQSKK